jgi:ribosomal protein S18 acetylase RimI-like enzyme
VINIREYEAKDERSWLECRVLSFLDSAYYDDVFQHKQSYSNPVIDLVAECDDKIVGFIEVEYEMKDGSICYRGPYPAAMIWNIGVLPDYRRHGLATQLLSEAKRIALEKGINRFEAFTRDDQWVHEWYKRNGFEKVMSYLHVYLNHNELTNYQLKRTLGMTPVRMLAHYTGDEMEVVKKKHERVHECVLFELMF